jgi:hypothetical protein
MYFSLYGCMFANAEVATKNAYPLHIWNVIRSRVRSCLEMKCPLLIEK